jgi:hypothetical protein
MYKSFLLSLGSCLLLSVHGNQVVENMLVDKNYVGKFKVGNYTLNMMALLNLDHTIVNSLTCPNCNTKVYNTSGIASPTYKNFTYMSPNSEVPSLDYEAQPVIDSLCIFDEDDVQICTPNTDSAEDDYTIMVLERYLTSDSISS